MWTTQQGRRNALALVLTIATGSAIACGNRGEGSSDSPTPRCIEITSLSRGRGVPASTQAAYKRATAVVAQEASFQEARLGLEGETRASVEFSDSERATEVFAKLTELAQGVDLLTIEWRTCETKP